MAGFLDFAARFGTEERCIEHLAGLRWPGGFVCSGCRGRVAWRLMSADEPGFDVAERGDPTSSGRSTAHPDKFLQRELAVAYQTAWTMAHKLRCGILREGRGSIDIDQNPANA